MKNNDRMVILLNDYRMMVEDYLKDAKVVEPVVEYFSDYTLEQLKEKEQIYSQNKRFFLNQKQNLGSYIISTQDPLDIEYISSAIRSAVLMRYTDLVSANMKTVEVLRPLFEKNTNYSSLSDLDLEVRKQESASKRVQSITGWITAGGVWMSDEEYNRFCDSCTELNLVNNEIRKRNTKEFKK